MKRIIDVHSHIIPGVDDGVQTFRESLEMLGRYLEQDVEAVICTPHYGDCGDPDADVIGGLELLRAASLGIKLYPGSEILYKPGVLGDVQKGKAFTMAGTNHILVEFNEWGPYHVSSRTLLSGLRRLANSEYLVILAHPERYLCVQNNPELCRKITAMGVKLQVNAYDIYQHSPGPCRDAAQHLVLQQLVSYIGSDCHGYTRLPELNVGVQWIYDHCPKSYADAIVHDNAAKIIKSGGA